MRKISQVRVIVFGLAIESTFLLAFALNLIFSSGQVVSVAHAAPRSQWCIPEFALPPCGGQPGKCTVNSNGSFGGFVADSAFVSNKLTPSGFRNRAFLEPYAQVCGNAQVKQGAHIGNFSSIQTGVILERDVRIGDNVDVGALTHIGEGAEVRTNSIIGSVVSIGAGTIIEEQVVIENAVAIGKNTQIKAGAYLGEGSRIGEGCTLEKSATIAAGVSIWDEAWVPAIEVEQPYESEILEEDGIRVIAKVLKPDEKSLPDWIQYCRKALIPVAQMKALLEEREEKKIRAQGLSRQLEAHQSMLEWFPSCRIVAMAFNMSKQKRLERENIRRKFNQTHLEIETLTQELDQMGENEVESQCPICFDLLAAKDRLTQTRCRHIFCRECLQSSLNIPANPDRNCPICRAIFCDMDAFDIQLHSIDS